MASVLRVSMRQILALNEWLPELAMVSEIHDGHMVFGFDSALLIHMCGEIYTLEYGLAQRAAWADLRRQLPWLIKVEPPRGVLLDDWAENWAWVDTMERRYGETHLVETLPPDWRSGVSVTAFEGYTVDHQPVNYYNLPEPLQEQLRRLGYSDGVT